MLYYSFSFNILGRGQGGGRGGNVRGAESAVLVEALVFADRKRMSG